MKFITEERGFLKAFNAAYYGTLKPRQRATLQKHCTTPSSLYGVLICELDYFAPFDFFKHVYPNALLFESKSEIKRALKTKFLPALKDAHYAAIASIEINGTIQHVLKLDDDLYSIE